MLRGVTFLICVSCAAALLLSGCAAPSGTGAAAPMTEREGEPPAGGAPVPASDAPTRVLEGALESRDVERAMRRVFEWQSDALGSPEPTWIQSTFMIGVIAAYEATEDTSYLGSAARWAEDNVWMLGPRELHADDHAAAQVYLDLARLTDDDSDIAATEAGLRGLIQSDESADRIWWWCDALFMAPPALVRASALTGDAAFADSLTGMWWDAADPLFDGEERLFHRDAAARDNRDGAAPLSRHGNKLFWSRGNGWVLAGIARTLEFLPEDHEARGLLTSVFTMMAERVVELQGDDGLWRTSLLDPPESYPGETSGSALICSAIAWGVNEGLLEPDAYAPAALLAWDGLTSSVDGEGRLGWVQGVGRSPGLVSEMGSAPYGSGAFLLAGSEVLEMVTQDR